MQNCESRKAKVTECQSTKFKTLPEREIVTLPNRRIRQCENAKCEGAKLRECEIGNGVGVGAIVKIRVGVGSGSRVGLRVTGSGNCSIKQVFFFSLAKCSAAQDPMIPPPTTQYVGSADIEPFHWLWIGSDRAEPHTPKGVVWFAQFRVAPRDSWPRGYFLSDEQFRSPTNASTMLPLV